MACSKLTSVDEARTGRRVEILVSGQGIGNLGAVIEGLRECWNERWGWNKDVVASAQNRDIETGMCVFWDFRERKRHRLENANRGGSSRKRGVTSGVSMSDRCI